MMHPEEVDLERVESKSAAAPPPGEGERRAQRGYQRQYDSAAAIIYDSLQRDELVWIGLADRRAGIVDDLVLGAFRRVIGHQFKSSQFPQAIGIKALLLGTGNTIAALAQSWRQLKADFPDHEVEIRYVTTDYPSANDKLVEGEGHLHSAAFLSDLRMNPARSLSQWRETRWAPLVDELAKASGLDEPAFDDFFRNLRIATDREADLVTGRRRSADETALISQIAAVLPKLIADPRDRDRWQRHDLLETLEWPDSFELRRCHQFPVGAYVQRNAATEAALRQAMAHAERGYVALLGPPGTGKSTLLQSALISEKGLVVVRYLAFMPGEGQGIGRAEGEDFLEDLIVQLKRTGLKGTLFRHGTMAQRQQQFGHLLQEAAARFQRDGIRTAIIVDGLDHVSREERPARSLLAELPLPTAIPAGVLFVLGTQRLDLAGIPPAVRDEAEQQARLVIVTPLSRKAVHRIADVAGLPQDISRDEVYEAGEGHPLVTRYLIEALRGADTATRASILSEEFACAGDVEAVYDSAWRGIRDDRDARAVLAYLARAEGPIQPELLALATADAAVERALSATRHLLAIGARGWQVFHNSFRLYLLAKSEQRFGRPDPGFATTVYRKLAELAPQAQANSPQRWMELRYLARAEDHQAVLRLAQPGRFRNQLAEGRSAKDIQGDIRLAFKAAKSAGNSEDIFRLLISRDEVERRSGVLEGAGSLVDAYLALGDLDAAMALIERGSEGGKAYELVDALLAAGEIQAARDLFDSVEPVAKLLGAEFIQSLGRDGLSDWASRVFHFREPDQILDAIERLSIRSFHDGEDKGQDEAFHARLRFEVARAAVLERPAVDIGQLVTSLKVREADVPYLQLEAEIAAHNAGMPEISRAQLVAVVGSPHFESMPSGWRRRAVFGLLRIGDVEGAKRVYAGLEGTSTARLEDTTKEVDPPNVVWAVVEQHLLATLLEQEAPQVPKSQRIILAGLQAHAEAIGELIGAAKAGKPRPPAEVARVVSSALSFLNHAKPRGTEDFFSAHQLGYAAPALGRAMIRAGVAHGSGAFAAVMREIDASCEAEEGFNRRRYGFRRAVALEAFAQDRILDDAERRLTPILDLLSETSPEEQVDEMAGTAEALATVGSRQRASDILKDVKQHTLGYSRPPKKDAQYSLWGDLFEKACAADPAGRPARTRVMLKLLDGLMQTEGRGSAYRIAPTVLSEAAQIDAGTALAAARFMTRGGMLTWDAMGNALLRGVLRRRPDMAAPCATCWASVVLPFYGEPHYRQDKLGLFLIEVVEAAKDEQVVSIIEFLQAGIETDGDLAIRAALLHKLAAVADARGHLSPQLRASCARWDPEAPPPEPPSSSPDRFEGVDNFEELKRRLSARHPTADPDGAEIAVPLSDGPDYEAVAAAIRLIKSVDLAASRQFVESRPEFLSDSRLRFTLAERAIDVGDTAYANELVDRYAPQDDERSHWNYWAGAGKLRFHEARIRLVGSDAHARAFEDFAADLAAGGEYVAPLLWDFASVFEVIDGSPNWASLWDILEEQIRQTRDFQLGSDQEGNPEAITDEALLASLYRWALTLRIFELDRQARIGALRTLEHVDGLEIFATLVRMLLDGEDDEPCAGMQLIAQAAQDQHLQAAFGQTVEALVDHPDFVVAVAAERIARGWSRAVQRSPRQLPAFYLLSLPGDGETYRRPVGVDPETKAMIVEDSLGWTYASASMIEPLAEAAGVSVSQIRRRCRQYITQWGGLERYGIAGARQLVAELRNLELCLSYGRPDLAAAARAARYVAGELLAAGKIPASAHSFLLRAFGCPVPRPRPILPGVRPGHVRRPAIVRAMWREEEAAWLQDVEADLAVGPHAESFMLAEFACYQRRHIRTQFSMETARLRSAPQEELGSLSDLMDNLPRATWLNGIVALDDPSPSIVARFIESNFPEIPADFLILCPHWVARLGWHQHPDNRLVYQDSDGVVVARLLWWRDGTPQGVDQDGMWGEGMTVTLTTAGRSQLELITGPIELEAYAWRKVTPERNDGEPRSTFART